MNVRRFTARSARDALVLVRQTLGEDAVILSTKPGVDGVEVLAMAPEGMQQIERLAGSAPTTAAKPVGGAAASRAEPRNEPAMDATSEVDIDVAKLSMSTLSFQDYVRERMLRRRQAALKPEAAAVAPARANAAAPERGSVLEQRMAEPQRGAERTTERPQERAPAAAVMKGPREASAPREAAPRRREPAAPVRREATLMDSAPTHTPNLADVPDVTVQMPLVDLPSAPIHTHSSPTPMTARHDQQDMLDELRQVKGLIEERFGALAFMEKLNRQPGQARLTQKLLDAGYSPALIRKIGDSLPMDVADEAAWAAGVLERNLLTADSEAPLEDQGGVYALVGATGVGKTTTTAKIAAAFAAKYGANNLGLITLDAYRIGAHEQLRAYGRILGVPVHTAHDRASLEDLLELLAGKKMVLIDTAGMAQRDTRTRELLEMLSHRAIRKLLVINTASQGETIEDVMVAYHATTCCGIVLSKMDEAVKLGPALDALIRLKLKVIGVANGQRVPEDWHRLSANALVQRSLRGGGSSAYKLNASDVSLVFTAPIGQPQSSARQAQHA